MQTSSDKSIQVRSIQRRLFHVAGSLFIFYYFIPSFLPYHIHKIWLLIIILLIVSGIELYRFVTRKMKPLDPMLREYEQIRPASYSYFTLGSIVLLAYFPAYISIPCILSAALCDPIIGILRQLERKRLGYSIAFLVGFFFFYFFWIESIFWISFTASLIGALSVVYAEYSSNLWVDDDFLIQIFPAIELYVFIFILETVFRVIPLALFYAF